MPIATSGTARPPHSRNRASRTVRPAAGTPNVIGVVIDPASRLPSSPPSSVPEKSYLGGSESAPPSGPGLVDAENETSAPSTSPSTNLTPRVVRDGSVAPRPSSSASTIARASSTGRGE